MYGREGERTVFQPQSLFLISIAFLLGIVLADGLPWQWVAVAAVLLAGLAVTLGRVVRRGDRDPAPTRLRAALRSRFALLAPLLLVAMALGALRHQLAQPRIDAGHIAWYNNDGQTLVITGVVVAPPDVRDSYIQLEVRTIHFHPLGSGVFTDVRGRLLARVPSGSDVQYGDRVVLTGTPATPPADELFSYRDYLARSGIHSYLAFAEVSVLDGGQGNPLLAAIYALREHALQLVYQLWPDPEASLLAGILLGVESGIPQDVRAAFNDTGATHIIAISGFNITIIAGLVAGAFGRWLGPRRGALAAAVAVGLYTVLVGADAAVVRAALMGGLGLFARQVGRRQDGLNTLALVAALMALHNPFILWDVGFQLSFAATLGLIVYAGPFAAWFDARLPGWLEEGSRARLTALAGEFLLFTVAANLTTLPLIIYHFQRLALLTLPVNVLILPVQPALMLSAGAALLLSLVWLPIGQLLALVAWPFAAFTIRVVEFAAGIPGAARAVGFVPIWGVLFFYLALFTLPIWRPRVKLRPALLFFALLLAAVLVGNSAAHAPDGHLHIMLLDVGPADAVLIETPDGRRVLINGGPSASTLSDALGRRLPLLERRLDWLVVASPAQEQLAALPAVVERYPPDNVLWGGNIQASFASRELLRTLADAGIAVTDALAGQVLDLGQGAQLVVLTTAPRGAALAVTWRDFELLLPIGIDFDDLELLAQRTPNVLLLPDHGYAPLNPPAWLEGLNAQLVLLSVDAGNRRGLPDRATLDVLGELRLLRTDLHGDIELITDGMHLRVESERD